MRRASLGVAMMEPLERRELLSSEVLPLLGYTKLGATWTYNTSSSITAMGDTNTSSGLATIHVNSVRTTYDSRPSYVIKTSIAGASTTTAFSADSSYVRIMASTQATGAGTFNFKLHDTVLAKRYMSPGESFSDSGTFGGSYSASAAGTSVSGTVSGKSTISTHMYPATSVTTSIGTFSNVTKFSYNVTLSGTLSVRYQGQTYYASFTSYTPTTVWALSGVGVLKSTTSGGYIKISAEGETETVRLSTSATLARPVVGASNKAPVNLSLATSYGGATIPEGATSGSTVGTFSTSDINAGESFTYTLVPGTGADDNTKFAISHNQLLVGADDLTAASGDYYHIRVRVTDHGGLSYTKAFSIAVA